MSAHAVLRTPGGALSLRVRPRPLVVGGTLVAAVVGLLVVAVATGDFPLSLAEVAETLLGGGDQATRFVVETLRLPRALCAILAGAALGVAGAIFQSITRNPLGSPDIVGFNQGSSAGAVLAVTVMSGGALGAAAGALAGGFVTAILVYVLAYRGGVQGYRLVLVGIGMAALMAALTDYLLTRAEVNEAQEAFAWIVGSLNARGWEQVRPAAAALAVLLPLALWLGRSLRMLELGDEAAGALGVGVERARIALVAVAVALSATATAIDGPILFVALAAPQVARRLTRSAEPGLVTAGLMGAALLQASDIAAQRLFAPTQLPVGVMTGAVGGLYLIWLLAHEWRSGRTA